VDRRQRKLEKQKRNRQIAKKEAAKKAARRGNANNAFVAAAARAPFGPCAVSNGWNRDGSVPELVTVVVTRRFADGRLLPGLAVVDRTCLGVKNAFASSPIEPFEADWFFAKVGSAHGGMERCDPLVVQSIVFHAIDYARRLGFAPQRDFPAPLFGPRPAQLLPTPWCAADKPYYISGPRDDVPAILAKLEASVGGGGYEFLAVGESAEGFFDDPLDGADMDLITDGTDDDSDDKTGEADEDTDDEAPVSS